MKKILLVEDDKFLNKVYQKKMEKEGFSLISLENGADALETAKKENPDLIILDLIMPVKDGFEVLAELKADPKVKDIPVFVLSNLGQKTDVEKTKKLGAAKHIVKSNISIGEVLSLIKKAS